MRKIVFLLLIFGVFWKFYNHSDSVTLGPGVLVSEQPYQESTSPAVSYIHDGYTITELAKFRIKAKVLSKKNYYFGREASLSPTDLALGWGNMSDESVLDNIEISQSNRFYYWHVESFPIPRREIETHSANMHLIPATDSVKKDIDNIREGEIVQLFGSLVKVTSSDGWYWNSSQTRNDTGNGACELIWVERVRTLTL